MKCKLLYLFLLTIVVITGHVSPAQALQPCRVNKIISPEGTEYKLQYDNTGHLQTITSPSEKYVDSFFYYKDSMVIITNIRDEPDCRTAYTFNKNGLLIHKKTEIYKHEGWIEDTDYEYKNTKLWRLKRKGRLPVEPLSSVTETTEIYTWQNGNPVKIHHFINGRSYGSVRLRYYKNKPFRTGDFHSYVQIMVGVQILKPANLLKSVACQEKLRVNYEFDGNGKIISMTEKEENDIRITKYEYDCN
ncbi:MAG: hypothetical protein QM731_24290 [Chitinophagaceae bacterium]